MTTANHRRRGEDLEATGPRPPAARGRDDAEGDRQPEPERERPREPERETRPEPERDTRWEDGTALPYWVAPDDAGPQD